MLESLLVAKSLVLINNFLYVLGMETSLILKGAADIQWVIEPNLWQQQDRQRTK